ncbi:MAG TPA: NAD(P)-binding protein, partial [Byssovorax sp.]
MTAAHTPVAVIGAGLTGLSTAFHLDRAGVGRRLFERSDHVGGHAVTVEDSGYRFDRTGHLLHLRDAEMRALALAWIGPGAIEIQRRSRVWSSGVYTRYPFQANTFGLPPEVANACLLGFLKAHFAPEKREPANFEEFCRATFGDGISEHFMMPYNTRLWGVSPRDITADWCQRFVPIPRLEDVVAGAVGLNDRELGYNASFVYPRLGIGQLTDGLARATGRVELSRAPLAIDVAKRELHFDDEIVGYD